MRVCGLKYDAVGCHVIGSDVTPRAGVWIEIPSHRTLPQAAAVSHPVRVCGLKFNSSHQPEDEVKSHPVRVCGLK